MHRLLALVMAALLIGGCTKLPVEKSAPTARVMDCAIKTPTPAPTQTPAPRVVTVAAVGDIMMMPSQIVSAKDWDTGEYDFSKSFQAVRPYLTTPDLMCGNLELTFAGTEYTRPVKSGQRHQRFSAPDSLAKDLRDAGFDVLTTANNHSLDYGFAGLERTAKVLEENDLAHTGTARTAAERNRPLVIEKNGVRIGVVAHSEHFNDNLRDLKPSERAFALNRLEIDEERYREDIAACRAAGTDFIIAFPHWGEEDESCPDSGTRIYARRLLEAGADAVLGSHSHRVQAAEYVTVERGGAPYTGLVVYSMGNFLSNMLHIPEQYGVYVRLTLTKAADGKTALIKAAYLPLLSIAHPLADRELHEVLPALARIESIGSAAPLSAYETGLIRGAREHVGEILTDNGRIDMEELCFEN